MPNQKKKGTISTKQLNQSNQLNHSNGRSSTDKKNESPELSDNDRKTLFTTSKITNSLSNARREDFIDELPPMRGGEEDMENNLDNDPLALRRQHPLMMTKNEYLAKQNKVFEELTGFPSWNDYRESRVKLDAQDESLSKITALVMAGLDQDVYNEFREQRFIMDEVEYAGDQAMESIIDMNSNVRNQGLMINYSTLRGQVSRLEVEFARMRRQKFDLEIDRNEACNSYQREMLKRIKLEQICRCLVKKVNALEKQEEISSGRGGQQGKKSEGAQLEKGSKSVEGEQNRGVNKSGSSASSNSNNVSDPETLIQNLDNVFEELSRKVDTVKSSNEQTLQMKEMLRRFFDQYLERKRYFDSILQEKEMKYQIYAAKAAKLKAELATERARSQQLSEMVEQSAKIQADTAKRELQLIKDLDKQSKFYIDLLLQRIKENGDMPIKQLSLKEFMPSLDEVRESKLSTLSTVLGSTNTDLLDSSSGTQNAAGQDKKQVQKDDSVKLKSISTKLEQIKSNESSSKMESDRGVNGKNSSSNGGEGRWVDDDHQEGIQNGGKSDNDNGIEKKKVKSDSTKGSNNDFRAYQSREPHQPLDGRPSAAHSAAPTTTASDPNSGFSALPAILREAAGKDITEALFKDQFANGVSAAHFFQKCFGFDIRGMPFGEVLRNLATAHSESDCKFDDCPMHGSDEENGRYRKEWEDITKEIDKLGHIPWEAATSEEEDKSEPQMPEAQQQQQHDKPVVDKPVFGPERPPSMQISQRSG